jgi:predicted AlkP superfamily pyrophosphatase or phosphodiesterase
MAARKSALTFIAAAIAVVLAGCQTTAPPAPPAAQPPHNLVLFIADGLRYGSVNLEDAPALAAVRAEGVDFANSHSVFPTVTTVNGAAIATGHYPGDTGDFVNSLYPGAPALPSAYFSRIVSLEDDAILKDMNARFGGNFLHETSLLAAARQQGYEIAILGKQGPAAIQDVAILNGGPLVDDVTGFEDGPAWDPAIAAAMEKAGIPLLGPPRGIPNRAQQEWLAKIATDVLLPRFAADHKPFILVFWSADPDASQHVQLDSRNALTPGINGPTARAAIRGASDDLGRLREALAHLGLDKTTDVFVTADHGFSTIAKMSKTSATAKMKFRDWPSGELPPGFLAIDLARALKMKVFEPNGLDVRLEDGLSPRRGSAMLGPDFEHAHVIIGASGGADAIYLPEADAPQLAAKIVSFLTTQDYTAAIFADDSFGDLPGALPLSSIGLKGAALTPRPAIIVGFRSFSTGCPNPEQCGAVIADTPLRTGQGMHGSFSRADTRNFMAAVGPDFRAGYVDPAPVSNADIAQTMARALNISLPAIGALKGRVATESLRGGAPVQASREARKSTPAANGFRTILNLQRVGAVEYYDAAGASGRTLGLIE